MHRLLPFILLAALVPAMTVSAGDRVYVIGMPYVDGESRTLPEVEALLTEAYARIGAQITFKPLPMLRDIKDANACDMDASAGRTRLAIQNHDSVILTTTPVIRTQVRGYWSDPEIKVASWTDLARYRTGYMRGDESTRISLNAVGIEGTIFTGLRSGFKALENNRLDVFVTHDCFVALCDMTGETSGLFSSPPLYKGHLYHCLNIKNRDLADRLSRVLAQMLRDGTSARLMGKYSCLLPDLSVAAEIDGSPLKAAANE